MPHDEFVPEDPMELSGVVLPGSEGQLEHMAECLVEEFVRLGWDETRLMTLFVNPMFLATNRIYRQKGEAYVRGLIRACVAQWNRAQTLADAARSDSGRDDMQGPSADTTPDLARPSSGSLSLELPLIEWKQREPSGRGEAGCRTAES